ncbi:MAG: YidH family protein [Actinomycetota bacterium]
MNLPRIRPRRHIGHDPDYRFTLANERTFLAWIRTALALIAGGLAVIQLIPEFGIPGGREILGASLIVLGTLLAVGSIMRWASAEEAMREDRPIPVTRLPIVLAVGVMVVTVIVAVLLLVE